MRKIVNKNGWDISLDVGLSLFSFLKINMYRDLEENKAKIASNMIVRALSGDKSGIITLSSEFDNFEHDEKTKPIDTYQVLDADSSQQDAILYSKKGVSFVLQGPPGTGKSQTITNIISESLADGKKILFVSEKMAALEVVHKRLSQVGLSNFCLNLHSYKANKKEILSELNQTLNLSKFKLQDDIPFRLESLKTARDTLNKYNSELHTNVDPLGSSIYEVNGKIAKLNSITDIIFKLNNVGETSPEKLIKYKSLLANFAGTIGKMSEDYETNPWRSSNVSNVTHELRHDIETNLKNLLPGLKVLNDCVSKYVEKLELDQIISMQYSENLITILEVASKSPTIPISWVLKDDIARLTARAEKYKIYKSEYQNLVKELSSKYSEEFFTLTANEIRSRIITLLQKAKTTLNATEFHTDAEIVSNLKATIVSLQKLSVEIASLQEVCEKSSGLLSGKPVENINQAIELTDFLSHLLANSKPTKEWFDAEKLKIVKRLFSEIKNKYEEIEKEEKPILSGFEKEIFDLDFLPMLKRFKVDYSSPFKIINKNYWNDKKVIQSLLKDSSKKIADNTILILLRNG